MIYRLNDFYYVRTLLEADLDGSYPLWFEDQEVCLHNSHGKFFKTRSQLSEFVMNANRQDRIVWAICHVEDGHVGNIALENLSFVNRDADLGVLIGDKRHWGRGVASEAAKKILYHGFNKLNLRRIHCQAAESNRAMLSVARKLGMIEEGRRRQAVYVNGGWQDIIEFGILLDEFIG